jgi:Predicted integral membrane protein (DUF2269)
MSWYELLLFLHVLAVAAWFGSGLAITVLTYRVRAARDAAFGPYAVHANWWAGRAHPTAAVVILLAGIGLVIEGDLSFGELWITLAFIGWIALMAIGGALTGKTGTALAERAGAPGAVDDPETQALTDRLLLSMRIELALLVLIIADMIAKPGG